MQANKPGEHELVKICMAALCKSFGFADCENVVQRDLQYLCDSIESKTGVLISLSTIKRLLNGQFSRVPQIATLDAIAMTLGYQNWQDFKINQNAQTGNSGQNETVALSPESRKKTFSRKQMGYAAAIFALIVIELFSILKPWKSEVLHADKAHFSAQKVTGNDLPNTVIFRYNIDTVQADSFFIQQSWDKHRRVKINKHNYMFTDIYYEPGYHVAKLIANDKIIKTFDVSIPTDKWVFYAKEKVPKSNAKYILNTTGIKDGIMQLTPDEIINNKIDIKKENNFLQVYFPSKFTNSSDNFVLKYRIKVTRLNNESCPYFMGEVFCQKYFMYFQSTLKGCTSEISAQFAENASNGKTSDLSALGSDITNWQNVEVRVINKQATISINNTKIFSAAYTNSCGLITGLGFISNGLCQVDFVDLKTLDGKEIYSNDFNH